MRLFRARKFGTLLGFGLLCFGLSILSPYFLTVSNILNVVQQSSIIAIVAAGMTFVIISGGIDLSVGSVLAVSGLMVATLLHAGVATGLSILIGLLVGFSAGCLNGALVAFGQLPPFIATLGTMSVFRGFALMSTDGGPISGFSATLRVLADGEFYGIPIPVILMLAIYASSQFVLTRTKLGRYTYAIGGNEEAAVLAGINVVFHKTVIYGICGTFSALAAILLTARLNSAQPIAGTMYELDAIAAAVIGGASLFGGAGSMYGTLIGALIMGVLRNGLNLLNVSAYLQQVAIGSVIIAAVLVDTALKRRNR